MSRHPTSDMSEPELTDTEDASLFGEMVGGYPSD